MSLCLLSAGQTALAQQPANPAPDPKGPPNIFYGAIPPDGGQGPVIVFVHGLKGIAADWWVNAVNNSPNPMYGMAYAAGYRTAFVSLNAKNQRDASATWLENASTLKQLLITVAQHYGVANFGFTGANYNTVSPGMYVVTHSMGSLSMEAALLNSTLTALDLTVAPMVKAVFELAPTNQGTPLADWAFGNGAGLALLFGLHTPAVQSLEVSTVESFRAVADPILASSGIRFYTFAGNDYINSKDPVILATGLILSGLKAGTNDGLVPLTSTPLPYSYSFDVGQINTNHFGMIEGNLTFPAINAIFPNLERQIPGFQRVATNGFDSDGANSFAWSMKWFQGKLYVGTGRLVSCVTALTSDVQQGTNYYALSSCPADPRTMPLAAEIWQYTPATKTWQRVYQSPQNIPLGVDANGNQIMTARDIGYRGMEVFTEPDGTQALYVGAVTSASIFGNTAPYTFQNYPPPRILRTTDGLNWAPLPQDPDTFLGDISKNYSSSGTASFHALGIRSLKSYNGMLFATAGSYVGDGMVIASANPSAGNSAWYQAAPLDSQFPVWTLEVFNNQLYVAGGNNGYFVAYTNAQGSPPYTWNFVVNNGANVQQSGPLAALSTAVFNNQLYVGTAGTVPANGTVVRGCELIRVHPDNSWELVVGDPFVSAAGPESPVSGIGQYFDNQFNHHFWRMTVYPSGAHQGLYLGTYDSSVSFESFWEIGDLVNGTYGGDLMMTPDGTNWKLVTTNGFGDGQNEGFRSIESTPFGLFVGTGRLAGGAQVWLDQSILDFNNDGIIDQNDVNVIQSAMGQSVAQNDPRDLDQDGQITANDVQLMSSQCTYPNCASTPFAPPPKPPAPLLASAPQSSSGGVASLSWSAVPSAAQYRVYRQTTTPLLQIFPPGGVTIRLGLLPIKIPQDVLNGKLNSICPTTQPANAPLFCSYVYLIEAATVPGNEVGFPVSLDYLGTTQSTSFEDIPPSALQSLYYVRAEDAGGNLSEPSNVVGGPSFANSAGPSASPSVTESPDSLTFSATAGSTAPVPSQNLQIATVGGATALQFTASASVISPVGGNWLQIAQTTGTAPIAPATFSLGVTVNPAGLAPGTYLATIVVNGQDGSSHPVTVTLNVAPGSGSSNNANAIATDKNSLSFAYTVGGTVPASQTVSVSSASASAAFAVVAIFNQPTINGWLLFNPASGNTTVYPSTIPLTIGVAPTGLAAGSYSAILLVADSNGSVQTINITLTVSPGSQSSGGSQPALISASARSLSFAFTTGGTPPAAQALQVTAGNGAVISFTVRAVGSNQWLGVNPVAGSTPTTLTVTATPRNLPVGTYTEALVFGVGSGTNHQEIPVTLKISAPAPPPPAQVAGHVIPQVKNGAGWSTTILLVNNSTSPQPFTIAFSGDAGSALILPLGSDGNTASVSGTIPPGGQRAIQSDGSGGIVSGWASINADPSVGTFATLNAPVSGGLAGGSSVSACTTPVQQIFLPFDQTSNGITSATGVSLANPNPAAAEVTFVFTDDSGYPIPAATATVAVPANGHYSSMLGDTFPATSGKRGVVILTSTQLICGLGMRYDGTAFTTVSPLLSSAASTGAFTQVLNGDGSKTSFLLVNTGTQAASFTLNFRGDDSTAWTLPLGSDGNQSSVTGTLAPGMIRILQSDGSGSSTQDGWATLSSTGSITGTALVSKSTNSQALLETSEPVNSGGATQLYLPFDQTSSSAQMSTGVSLVNANSTAATVNVVFAQANGQQTAPKQTITVPANGHFTGVLGDLYPTIQGTKGIAYLVSNVPLMGMGFQLEGQAYISIPLLTLSGN